MVMTAVTRRRIGLGDSGVCLYCRGPSPRLVADGWTVDEFRRPRSRRGCRHHRTRPPARLRTRPSASRPAAAALRVAQGRQDQCPARALERAQVAWVFQRKGLPVEIIAEFENWRRIRDSDGDEGWVYQSMLSGKRTALVAPWRKEEAVPMYSRPDDAARRSSPWSRPGVVGDARGLHGRMVQHAAPRAIDGWVAQPMLWGVYPGEQIERLEPSALVARSAAGRSCRSGRLPCRAAARGRPVIVRSSDGDIEQASFALDDNSENGWTYWCRNRCGRLRSPPRAEGPLR